MDTSAPKFLLILFLLHSILIVCSTGLLLSPIKEQTLLHSTRKDQQLPRTIQHDSVNYPSTTPATNPVTTPATVTVSPAASTPGIVTVPSATPVTVTPTPPSAPVTVSPTTPTPNPTNSPVPVTNPSTNTPGAQPTTPVTNPVVAPPAATTNAPAVPGQSWCVAKSGVPEKTLQAGLDYACGIGKADCSAIQQGASCYNPNSLQNHASYAFNSYYQRNPVPTSCDFGNAAVVTNANPSSGSCVFTTSSSSTSPTTASPVTTTPTPTPTTPSSAGATPTGSGTPPTILNASYPGLGGATTGFGEGPSSANVTSTDSLSSSLQPFIKTIIVVISIITGGIVLDI